MNLDIKLRANTFICISLFSGGSFPVLLYFLTGVNIAELLFLFSALFIPSALFFVVASGRTKTLKSYLSNKKSLFMIGITGLLMYVPMEFLIGYAEHFVSASLATVIFRTAPILMLLFIPTLLRERLTKTQFIALMLGFVGVFIAVTGGNPMSLLHGGIGSNLPIIAMLLLAAFSYALSSILIKRYVFDMQSSLFIYSIFLFAFSSILFASWGFPLSHLTPLDIGLILYIGIIYNVYSFYIYFYAFRILKTTFSTNLYFLSPFVTFFFAWLVLGETIKPYYLIIGALVGVGILIQRFDAVGGTYRSKSRSKFGNSVLFDVTGAFVNTGETAIRNSLSAGGRVIALKIEGKHTDNVRNFLGSNDEAGVYTDNHATITQEAEFVRKVVDAKPGDMVVLKAGHPDEAERFFTGMDAKVFGETGLMESDTSSSGTVIKSE